MGSEWSFISLKDTGEWFSGGTPSKSKEEFWGGDIPWISAKSMYDYRLGDSDLKVTPEGAQNGTRLVPKDTILLLVRGSMLHQRIPVGITTREVAFNQDVKAIIPTSKYIPKFLLYWFMANEGMLLSVVDNTGIGAGRLSTDLLHALKIPCPPISEQKPIVSFLNSLDDKIELNRKMNETLEQMAQALFKSWFVDFDPVIDSAILAGNPIPDQFAKRALRRPDKRDYAGQAEIQNLFPSEFELSDELGWIPKGWEVSTFGNVSKCFDSKRVPLSKKQREEKKPGLIPYYGATSIMDYVNEWIFDDIYLLLGEDGSVIKEDGTPFVQYIWGKAWVNNHAHVLQGKDSVSTEQLMLFIQSQNITAYITGAVQLKLNQGNMNRIPFLLAKENANNEFKKLIDPFYKKIRKTTEENLSLTKLRDTLLPKLLSGELNIKDAEKEMEGES